MIYVFHGDNIARSREAFIAKKESVTNPASLRGGEFTITDLIQILEGGSLFSETKYIFLEDIFAKIKKQEELEAICSILSTHNAEDEIYIWESKVITPKQLKLLKDAKLELFKLPTALFTFLDMLSPANAIPLLRLSHTSLSDVGEEILFAMLIRHVRLLLAVKESASIDEVKRLAPWQKAKLVQQAARFTNEELLSLHHRLFQIDKDRKTGELPITLGASIDFLFLQLYH